MRCAGERVEDLGLQPGTDAKSAIAQLRNDKARLRGQLEVAIAHLQRLTLENRALREELERAVKVVRIWPKR